MPGTASPRAFGRSASSRLDFPRRHVALDRVAFDHGGMAAAKRVRYAEARTVGFGILHILGLHTEAVRPQMAQSTSCSSLRTRPCRR